MEGDWNAVYAPHVVWVPRASRLNQNILPENSHGADASAANYAISSLAYVYEAKPGRFVRRDRG